MTQEKSFELQELYEQAGRAVAQDISNVQRGSRRIGRSEVIGAAYVLLTASGDKEDEIDLSSVEAFCASARVSEERETFLKARLGDVWPMVTGQKGRYHEDTLRSIILFHEERGEEKTPESVSRLACKLFDFRDNDELADFCLGNGAFTMEAYLNHPALRFHGVEMDASAAEIASIRMETLGCSIDLERVDLFDTSPGAHKYRNIFSNYPFGLRLREGGFDGKRLLQKIPRKAAISSDWLFNAAIVERLEEDGKGVAVMTSGSAWNTLDRPARRYFIENGYLEAVIALPEKLFEYTNISTMMVVLSRNNRRTMLVDATGLCEKGRRFNVFTDAQIDEIAYAVSHETANSRYVSQAELVRNDYVLNPAKYLREEISIENGVPFASIMKSITRGATLRASELDEMMSETPTDCQYLMLANIQLGQIDDNLPYIKGIQDNQRKYCLKDRALILSKNGAPFKIAVARTRPGQTILANGNLYIIEIDEDKADPYFVKAFLESELGSAQLKSAAVGTAIPSIGVEALKGILIPQIPLEEQRALAARYVAKAGEVARYQRELQRAYEDLSHIYDNKE
ncbi:MAG: N-6 DNA methylase [Oscillibacter sp.]|nr:N-6 DNA methylase [Oscillibacter sp.]